MDLAIHKVESIHITTHDVTGSQWTTLLIATEYDTHEITIWPKKGVPVAFFFGAP